MPLTDLVRYFNAAEPGDDTTLYLEAGRAAAWHRGFRLTSLFQPILDLATWQVVGHRATLAVRDAAGQPATPDLYALCAESAALVGLDRLTRTLHALNFLGQRRHAGGYLQVAVDYRHLLAVPNQHGLVYEAILKRCGLGPEDIVLEVRWPAAQPTAHLQQAVAAYRTRGYRLVLAVDRPETAETVVALGGVGVQLSVRQAAFSPPILTTGPLIAADLDGLADYERARAAGIRHGWGAWLGVPHADCRPTHPQRKVA